MRKISMNHTLKDYQSAIFQEIPSIQTNRITPYQQECSTSELRKLKSTMSRKILKASIEDFYKIKQSEQSLIGEKLKENFQKSSELNFEQNKNTKNTDKISNYRSSKLVSKFLKLKKDLQLKNVVKSQRIDILKKGFIQKLKRNNIYSQPVIHNQYLSPNIKGILDLNGIQIKEQIRKVITAVLILSIIFGIFISTLSLLFHDISNNTSVKFLQIGTLIIYFIEIILNLITVRFSLGRKLESLREISINYIKQNFYIDFTNFVIMFLITLFQNQWLDACRMIIFLKLPDCFQKIRALEVYLIENYYKEQYWQLIKVFLFNFLYAHILSIILISMKNVNPKDNWIIAKGLSGAPWYQTYIWSYYWSTTIMLTIGFGDIVPVSFQEALVMVFIQTISCIILAYNINCVGTLISKIRFQDQQKTKKLNIFKKLVNKHKVSQQLSQKINNFIEENSNIKKYSNIQEQVEFVGALPTNFKTQYLDETNKNVFKSLFFFGNLMQKTLSNLAQNIKIKLVHPLQVLLNKDTNFDLMILKHGQIGCKPKTEIKEFKNNLMNKVNISQKDRPFLLHTNFITKDRSKFKIISIVYSTLYYLQLQNVVSALKKFSMDYQLYCQLKDKSKILIDQFQVFICEHCKTKHTQFNCPKYHFIPIKTHVIDKYLRMEKMEKNKRQQIFKRKKHNQRNRFCIFYETQKQILNKNTQDSYRTRSKNLQSQFIFRKSDMLQSNAKKLKPMKRSKNEVMQSNYKFITKSQQNRLLDNTTQMLKSYVAKIFRVQNEQDEIWLINTDKMKDFSGYFTKDNPSSLQQKFQVSKRIINIADPQPQSLLLHYIQDQFWCNSQRTGRLRTQKQKIQPTKLQQQSEIISNIIIQSNIKKESYNEQIA